MRKVRSLFIALALPILSALVGCNARSKHLGSQPQPSRASALAAATAPLAEGSLRLGTAIEASGENVALEDVAKTPNAFAGKKFTTTGTVTAVCQHMGCWMELKGGSGEAHVKMAGHSFFVPKTASGRKARVLATLVTAAENGACSEAREDTMGVAASAASHPSQDTPKKGCRAEAETQLGRPLAKLELLAEGVELM